MEWRLRLPTDLHGRAGCRVAGRGGIGDGATGLETAVSTCRIVVPGGPPVRWPDEGK